MLLSSEAENRNNKIISVESKGERREEKRRDLDFLIHPIPPN